MIRSEPVTDSLPPLSRQSNAAHSQDASSVVKERASRCVVAGGELRCFGRYGMRLRSNSAGTCCGTGRRTVWPQVAKPSKLAPSLAVAGIGTGCRTYHAAVPLTKSVWRPCGARADKRALRQSIRGLTPDCAELEVAAGMSAACQFTVAAVPCLSPANVVRLSISPESLTWGRAYVLYSAYYLRFGQDL